MVWHENMHMHIIVLHCSFVEVCKFDDNGIHCLPHITFAFQPHGGHLIVLFSMIIAI